MNQRITSLNGKRCKIAFDLDETLVDLTGILFPLLEEMFGAKMVRRDCYSLEKCFGVTREQITEALEICYQRWEVMEIYEGAPTLMRELYAATKDPILIVTARPLRYATETHQLVKRIMKKIPYVLVFSGGHNRKLRFLADHPYFVEDRRKTAVALAKRGKEVFLLDHEYNKMKEDPRGVHRIQCLWDLADMYYLFV